MTEIQAESAFKVIIAGGSIAGLSLAIALERAGIDYVLLEKRDLAPELGQSILVLPCTILVLQQLGLEKELLEAAVPISMRYHYRDGAIDTGKAPLPYCTSDELDLLRSTSGRPVLFVDRHRFLRTLLDGVRDKTRLRSREGVASFVEHEHGVTVRTDNGNVVEGSILVGADGVHSGVRMMLADQLREAGNKKGADILSRSCFRTRYACLTATSRNEWPAGTEKAGQPFLKDGDAVNTYFPREQVGGFAVAGIPGLIFWAIYIPLESLGRQQYPAYPSPKFGQADVAEAMRCFGHCRVTPDFSLADLNATIKGAGLLAMEEGIVSAPWHSPGGRVVLMGDAVHKATANLGMGGNLCIDDACTLANELVSLLKKLKGGNQKQEQETPSVDELRALFARYEKAERPRAHFVHTASGVFAGFETASRWWGRTLLNWVFPLLPSRLKMLVFHLFDRSAPRLNFVSVME